MNSVSVNDLAASVRQARRKLGWTQEELAERSGVSRDWIIGLEKAKSSQEIALVLRTLKALDLTLSLGNRKHSSGIHIPLSSHPATIRLDEILEYNPEDGKAR
jgi:transcriptional regulator with XRE-family HTH domain